MLLALVDRGLEHLALGCEPEAVVDEARVTRHQFVLEVHCSAVERDALDAAMGSKEDRSAGGLVNAPRFHPDEPIFDEIEATDAVVVTELVEHCQQRSR